MQHIIYGLFDPSDPDKTIRYVGFSSRTLTRRVIEHLVEAKKKARNHRHYWINSLRAKGLRPELVTLEMVTAETWQERERFWIAQFETLVNSTTGGEGLINPSAEVRERIGRKVSASLKGNNRRKGVPHDAEMRAKISAAVINSEAFKASRDAMRGQSGTPHTDEAKAKISASKIGKPHPRTPEWTSKIAVANTGKKQTRETIERRSKGLIGNKRALGNVMTEAARAAIAVSRAGSRIITDGKIRKLLKADETMPKGWMFVRDK